MSNNYDELVRRATGKPAAPVTPPPANAPQPRIFKAPPAVGANIGEPTTQQNQAVKILPLTEQERTDLATVGWDFQTELPANTAKLVEQMRNNPAPPARVPAQNPIIDSDFNRRARNQRQREQSLQMQQAAHDMQQHVDPSIADAMQNVNELVDDIYFDDDSGAAPPAGGFVPNPDSTIAQLRNLPTPPAAAAPAPPPPPPPPAASVPPPPTAPAADTMALPVITVCPHCNHDLRAGVIDKPSQEIQYAYLGAILAEEPYEQSFDVFNGRLSIRFRALLIEELRTIYRQVEHEHRLGELNDNLVYLERLHQYRMALQLQAIHANVANKGISVDLPARYSPDVDARAATTWIGRDNSPVKFDSTTEPTALKAILAHVLSRLHSEPVYRIVVQRFEHFNRILGRLEALSGDPDTFLLAAAAS